MTAGAKTTNVGQGRPARAANPYRPANPFAGPTATL
jgi:hypothetical protein